MLSFEIHNRWTGKVQFTAEIDATEDTPLRVKVGLAVLWGYKNDANLIDANLIDADLSGAVLSGADLSGAVLSDADLSDAVLRGADLSDADLRGAVLSGADLSGADLSGAVLSGAVLSGAVLSGADLRDADLSGAVLDSIKWDFFGRLSVWPNEADGLLLAVQEGRINGSSYTGDCACFVGTVAKLKEKHYEDLNGLKPDSGSPTERLFLGIKTGDTPDTNPVSRTVEGWLIEFIRHRDAARMEAAK